MTESAQSVSFDVPSYMRELGQRAREASRLLGRAESEDKNAALCAIAEAILADKPRLVAENQKDLDAGRESGLDAALLDRLELTDARIEAMVEGLHQIAALADPVGAISDLNYRPSGIQVGRMRVPLGVIGIIYESRPNVTADAAAMPVSCAVDLRRCIPIRHWRAALKRAWKRPACRLEPYRWWRPQTARQWVKCSSWRSLWMLLCRGAAKD